MINREGASWQLNAAGVVGGGTMGVGIATSLQRQVHRSPSSSLTPTDERQ